MAIIQDTFDIPEDINIGLLTGQMRRIGGTVRYADGQEKGQIVKLLKPIKLEEAKEARGVIDKARTFLKDHKKEIIIAGGIIAIYEGGKNIYQKIKAREPKDLRKFRFALKTYIDAIRAGSLNSSIIDEMIVAVNKLKENRNYNKLCIQLTMDDIETLTYRIKEYTEQLIENNRVGMSEILVEEADDAIISLQRYLDIQKTVFQLAA